MAKSVLITQCLQRDFIEPIEASEPLPNKLHVGREEASRLMGHEPLTGPIALIMHWARQQPEDELEILHIRDWHDDDDPQQHAHLEGFGSHCVQGTRGAALVLGLEEEIAARPNEHLVDSIALSDFEHTALPEHMSRILAEAAGEPIKVGVIGVWTEAKVSFLLYDLLTRCGIGDLATCSALTASASRSQHFNALEQLGRILGVEVFDSFGEFADWFRPGSVEEVVRNRENTYAPTLNVFPGDEEFEAPTDDDRDVLGFLFRDSAEVDLHPLSGGYSGALVYRAQARDAIGHDQAPCVAKVGPRWLIGKERACFERVEPILGNYAPSVKGFVDFGDRAGIKYSYAAMGQGAIRTFQSLFEKGLDLDRVDEILAEVFEQILGPFYSAAQSERLPLLEHYTFSPEYADRSREKVAEIYGPGGMEETIAFPDGSEHVNPAEFYTRYVPKHLGRTGEYHYVSYVHGDLNGANILVDSRDNVWIIDFFHTERGHVLKDLLKLENDLLYIYTPVASEEEITEALKITRALLAVKDLRAPLPEEAPGVTLPAHRRTWQTLRILRSIMGKVVREDRNPLQTFIPMLRYSMHTLSFFEADELQKRWALFASSLSAEKIMNETAENRDLRVAWLEGPGFETKGKLGMTLCPGRRDHGRNLGEDLDALKSIGVSRLYGLITDKELDWAGVKNIAAACEERGIRYSRLPIIDQGVPSIAEARELSAEIEAALDAGETVVIHCIGGLGRTGAISACVAIDHGLGAEDAIAVVRRGRGPRAVESPVQMKFVEDYAEAVT
jgi:protein-tyrosine phosphatase/nicotinamidase-related amidase